MSEGWLMREFERARKRSEQVPSFARPVLITRIRCGACVDNRHQHCRKPMYGQPCSCGCRGYADEAEKPVPMKGHNCVLPVDWLFVVAPGTTFTCGECDRLWTVNDEEKWQSDKED